ncbi:MAG: hypothetical protein AAFU85_02165 [Planctomycetota bacterium]
MSREEQSIRQFQEVIDCAEMGHKPAEDSLRKLVAEVTRQAPIDDVIKMADLVLRMQRQAYQQNRRSA